MPIAIHICLFRIENLNPNTIPPSIIVTAKSLLPYCHFEMIESDYLASDRRDARLPGPSDYDLNDIETRNKIRVVEFKMLGTEECHNRYIYCP